VLPGIAGEDFGLLGCNTVPLVVVVVVVGGGGGGGDRGPEPRLRLHCSH
jgi:hypothetical protein